MSCFLFFFRENFFPQKPDEFLHLAAGVSWYFYWGSLLLLFPPLPPWRNSPFSPSPSFLFEFIQPQSFFSFIFPDQQSPPVKSAGSGLPLFPPPHRTSVVIIPGSPYSPIQDFFRVFFFTLLFGSFSPLFPILPQANSGTSCFSPRNKLFSHFMPPS